MGDHNNAYAEQFCDVYDELFPIGSVAEPAVERLVRRPDGRCVSSLLELGMGNGRYVVPVAGRGVETVGVDIAASMVERTRRHATRTGVEVEVIQGDCRTFDPAPRIFDVVAVLGATFGMFDRTDQGRILDTCRTALAPNGRIVVETHNRIAVEHLLHPQDVTPLEFARRGRSDVHARSTYHRPSGRWQLDYRWQDDDDAQSATETSFPVSPCELAAMATERGLRVTSATAGWTDQPTTEEEVLMVITLEARGKGT